MRGMKAFEAQPVRQGYAEGGVVNRLKGMLGLDDERNARIAEYKRSQAADKAAAAAPVAALAPNGAITDYSSGAALKRREQAAGLKDGGPVRGPGTGTSDDVPDEVSEGTYIMPTDSTKAIGGSALSSMGARGMGAIAAQVQGAAKVPVNLSNGEFKLPPEQVHAIGVQALDQMKAATHAPAAQQRQGMKPELFFANGGEVGADEQERLRNQTQAYVTGAQAAAETRPAAPPAQPSASTADPARGMAAFGHYPQLAARQPQNNNPTTGAPAPAAAPTAPTQVEGWRTKAVMDGAAEDAQASWNRGGMEGVAGAAGAVARGAVTAVPTAVGEFAYNTAAPVARGMGAFFNGLTGGETAQATSAASPAARPSMPSTATAPVAPALGAQPGAPAAGARPTVQAPGTGGALPDPQIASGTGQVNPGVYQHGRGQYSDQASGMGMPAGFTGQPSAQNAQAAEALAGRSQQESMNRVSARGMGAVGGPGSGPVAPGTFTGGFSGVIGTDPAAGRERKAMVDALTTPMRGAQNGQLTSSQRQGMAGLLDAERKDASSNRQADQTASTQRDIANMREQGDTGRAVMREQGEGSRAGARNQIDTQRVNIEARGARFKEQEALRIEGLNQRYEAAKMPEERAAIAQQIRDMRGVAPQNPNVWDSVALPGSTDAMGNKTEGVLAAVNKQTGEMRRYDGGAKPAPPANHVDALKKNPALAAQFDQQYGAGAAARAMGGR